VRTDALVVVELECELERERDALVERRQQLRREARAEPDLERGRRPVAPLRAEHD
jgi:hypothetical protein